MLIRKTTQVTVHLGGSGGEVETGLELGDSGDIESELQCTSCQTWSNSCTHACRPMLLLGLLPNGSSALCDASSKRVDDKPPGLSNQGFESLVFLWTE